MTDARVLLQLLSWMSPSFPVGAFSYSHGLEWAVEEGEIRDQESLTRWVSDLLTYGTGRSDAVLCSLAMRSSDLTELGDLARALCPTEERLLEADAQGQAFLRAVNSGWPELVPEGFTALPYPVAVGAVTAQAGIPRETALNAYLHAFCANLVSAGLRLVPLGQTDGVRSLAALEEVIAARAEWAASAGEDDLWSFAPFSDIASMKHETQYTRLFRS